MSWCTKDSGTDFKPYGFVKMVLDVLYDVLSASLTALRLFGQAVHLIFPSGFAPQLFDGTDLIDFRLPEKKFWAVKFRYGDIELGKVPLPAVGLKTLWQTIIAPYDYHIGDAESTYFRDDDGEVKLGSEFSPEKRYGLLEHGVVDLASLTIIISIAYGISKLGIPGIAANFVRKIMTTLRARKMSSAMQSVDMQLQSLMAQVDDNDMDLEDLIEDTQYIRNRVQVRLK